MAKNNVSFKLKNVISELDKLGRKLESFGKRIGLPKKSIFQINLALDELFTNIVNYGFPEKGPHWIKVALAHEDGKIRIRLEDTGVPFDPASIQTSEPERRIEDCKVGGLGLHLVNKIMDEFVYERCGNYNIVTLTKYI